MNSFDRGDVSRWLITKRMDRWYVCPPIIEGLTSGGGGAFDTGAQAFAEFAKGEL